MTFMFYVGIIFFNLKNTTKEEGRDIDSIL